MGIFDFLIIGVVFVAVLAAVRFLKKNGNSCGGCSGDCMNCAKNKK